MVERSEIMEWKFVIHHFYTTEIHADSTICYNAVYNTEREGINQAKVYIKENNLKCDLLIRMYRRKRNSNDNWELYSRHCI